jgi:hypothetical protein
VSRRAQTASIGLILLLGITVLGTTAIVVFGDVALSDTDDSMNNKQAEHSMTQFDAEAAEVALGDANANTAKLPTSSASGSTELTDEGWIRIDIVNRSTGDATVVINQTLGAVVYDRGGTEVAYQGGGVWRKSGNGTRMVSPPEFHYRDATLTLPIITVAGNGSLDGQVTLSKGAGTERVFPNDTYGNPLTEGKMQVVVRSEYYEAWETFFEQRTDGSVELDHDNETATLELVVELKDRDVSAAAASTAGGGKLKIAGNGARTDSYNSTIGDYAATKGGNGTILTAGDVVVKGDGAVNGTITSGGEVQVGGNGFVDGDVEYTTREKVKESQVTGDVRKISGVDTLSPVGPYVEDNFARIKEDRDNGLVSVIVDNETELAGSTGELTAGNYYFEDLTLDTDGEALVLNTTDGNIEIAVRDYIKLDGDTEIRVEGDNEARFYVKGEDGLDREGKERHIILEKESGSGPTMTVPGENATQLWVYGDETFSGFIRGADSSNAEFVGAIYAPAGIAGSGSVFIKHAEVYGGVVTGAAAIEQGSAIHYDRALEGKNAVPLGAEVVRITYVHVTVNEIEVDDT